LVGIDVGGTFTDVVAVDRRTLAVRIHKVPSTPHNQAEGVLRGILELCGSCARAERIAHGTTVATNTVLENTGAVVALVTTAGFRDTLEIGRCRRNVPDSMFDTKFVRPRPLVPRHLRFEVTERIRPSGEILIPLAEAEVSAIAARIRDAGVTAVAVCFLHAYLNPTHESRAKEILEPLLPDAFICTSSEVLPELREFERFSTTVMNAFIAPRMRRYVHALVDELKAHDYAGDLYTMASHGGIMSSETTMAYPIRTILSGPASGVNGAIFVGHASGMRNLITYDMGGTSTDVCLVENLEPLVATQTIFHGIPVNTPLLDIHTVGAGGGSIAWIDIDGALKVGPRSAGAVPGPACYGQGGHDFTITDANLCLGRLPESLLDGGLRLQAQLSHAALLQLSRTLAWRDAPEQLAEGTIRLAVAAMAGAIRKISIERGYDPRAFTLMAMGGAGPMHAIAVAEELGVREVLVPPWPGNISALGLLAGDLRHDYVRTVLRRLSELDIVDMERRYGEMEAVGIAALRREGVAESDIVVSRLADMRCVGQAFELMFPVPAPLERDALAWRFRELYRRRYGHAHEEELEVVNLRVACSGHTRKPALPRLAATMGRRDGLRSRRAYFADGWHETPLLRRDMMGAGDRVGGPVIIEEFGTTTVVPPGWALSVIETGALLIRSDARAEASDGGP
jgi:N-methylhydantoinase A